MEHHKYEPKLMHTSVVRICLNCGENGTDLGQCGRFQNSSFCDKEGQTMAWKDHKSSARRE